MLKGKQKPSYRNVFHYIQSKLWLIISYRKNMYKNLPIPRFNLLPPAFVSLLFLQNVKPGKWWLLERNKMKCILQMNSSQTDSWENDMVEFLLFCRLILFSRISYELNEKSEFEKNSTLTCYKSYLNSNEIIWYIPLLVKGVNASGSMSRNFK